MCIFVPLHQPPAQGINFRRKPSAKLTRLRTPPLPSPPFSFFHSPPPNQIAAFVYADEHGDIDDDADSDSDDVEHKQGKDDGGDGDIASSTTAEHRGGWYLGKHLGRARPGATSPTSASHDADGSDVGSASRAAAGRLDHPPPHVGMLVVRVRQVMSLAKKLPLLGTSVSLRSFATRDGQWKGRGRLRRRIRRRQRRRQSKQRRRQRFITKREG